MNDIQNYIGDCGSEADRKREQRRRQKLEEQYKELFVENPELLLGQDKCPDIRPPERKRKPKKKKETEKETE